MPGRGQERAIPQGDSNGSHRLRTIGHGPDIVSLQEDRRPRDTAARAAGALLLITAITTVVAVVGRVAADADQPTLVDSLVAISESDLLYGIGGAARLISGITLLAAAWLLLGTWIIRERLGTPAVPALFAASGVFTAVSGACAVALALSVPDGTESVAAYLRNSLVEPTYDVRWLTGKIGFALAGLALIVAARYQWKAGGTLRRISPVSALIGIAMQFIWIDAATIMHPIYGTAFFLWLVAIGAMLMTGRVERQFNEMIDSSGLKPQSAVSDAVSTDAS